MSYEERRVRVKVYGSLASKSPLLVEVPGVRGKVRRLHTLAAAALETMAAAIERDIGVKIELASGWRRHKWTSRAQYEKTLVSRFGSVREGRKWLAYNSPHETGLAMDIGTGGLWPTKSTRKEQKRTPLHEWLVEHAHEYGWHPYKLEPWHWEFPLSLEAYGSGVIGEDDPGPPEEDVSFGIGDEVDVIEEFEEEDELVDELGDELGEEGGTA
ncbi:M15 family metallopeptidase [Paraliomyxa miuraensis]|uniref:M15 family metallopeptidase n=1 Tax=Paraliomyxa miuraensis TaxID=376150 RepID=UPI002258EE83|nr:M15 family metallopeptidase [Paraliomyxa miuraensis]MCX4241075.1 M15 family metallopeptidase [Paraliomyxa miuraensis]